MKQSAEIDIKNLDNLGIVAGIIDKIGIEEKINKIVGVDCREKVSAGQIVKAIILNGLGLFSQPLYLFPKFFDSIPTEHLLGEGIRAEDLNDDKIGRTMDILYHHGLGTIFLVLALEAGN